MIIDGALQQKFPGLQVLELKMENLKVKEKDADLEAFKPLIQQKVREKFTSLDQIRDHGAFRAYRDFFWSVGIDPTKTRPASEALTRRIVAGKDLPTINTLVDAYNLASVESFIAIAAFDLDSLSSEDLFMRTAGKGEHFRGIGMDADLELKGIEIVIEDSGKLVAVYPYRDSDESKVSLQTRSALLLMRGVPGVQNLHEASRLSQEYVGRFCR